MTEEERKRLQELRWVRERAMKRQQLEEKLGQRFSNATYSFLPDDQSETLKQAGHRRPTDKWDQKLYLQTPIDQPEAIRDILRRFLQFASGTTVYLYFTCYNFGFVEIAKDALLDNWQILIDIDGNEVFCRIPGRPEFICLEKTEDFIIGNEEDGRQWIYEVTFSSIEIKAKLVKDET